MESLQSITYATWTRPACATTLAMVLEHLRRREQDRGLGVIDHRSLDLGFEWIGVGEEALARDALHGEDDTIDQVALQRAHCSEPTKECVVSATSRQARPTRRSPRRCFRRG